MSKQFPQIPEITSVEQGIELLTNGKKNECATAATALFREGVDLGLSFDNAYDRAVLLHLQNDHGKGVTGDHELDNMPEQVMLSTIQSDLEKADGSEYWDDLKTAYDLYRSWGLTPTWAAQSAAAVIMTAIQSKAGIAMDAENMAAIRDLKEEGAPPEAIEEMLASYADARAHGADPDTALMIVAVSAAKMQTKGDDFNPTELL